MRMLIWSYVVFFFFKQKTAYEMRISDWSSDVCSSDLPSAGRSSYLIRYEASKLLRSLIESVTSNVPVTAKSRPVTVCESWLARSEERRVGKECVSTCRSRWSPSH